MSNFNQFFRNTGAKEMVDRFLEDVDLYHPDKKIATLTHRILDPEEKPASYYMENGLTAVFKVLIEYTLSDSPNVIRRTGFEVPREINEIFIIEGAFRVSTNSLNYDKECRIKTSGSGVHRITFDYDKYYDISKGLLRISKINPSLGISERSMDFSYEEIDKVLEDPTKSELLRLTEYQSKKLMIKLDLDYNPEFVDTKLIDACLKFGDDRQHDLIIDKRLDSVPASFFNYLFKENNRRKYYTLKTGIRTYFTKHGELKAYEPNDEGKTGLETITTACIKFWKGAAIDTKEKEINVPPGINSINLSSLDSKVKVPGSVAYNSTFADLIDIADTPINNNTNLQNALTVSCVVTDDKVLFKAYSKEFQVITLEYIDYLNSKVVASEFVDYEKKELKPNADGQVEVKYRMKRKMVDIGEIDLIDLHPDYRLSSTTRRIPFVNYSDSVRISMGSSMLKQSIPLIHAERALVDTGNSEELKNNVLNEKFKKPKGKVKAVTKDEVIISVPGEEDVVIPRKTAIQSMNQVAIYTEPKVKVGQTLKEGDIITGDVGLQEDTYKEGVNSLVLFHAYFGLVNEDALVISESYADKIASYSIIDVVVNLSAQNSLKWIAPIGTRVKSKDDIVIFNRVERLNEVNRMLADRLGDESFNIGTLGERSTERTSKVPNNIVDAIVSDVMIQEHVNPTLLKANPDLTYVHTSEPVIKEYEESREKARKIIYDNYPEYVASDTLNPIKLDPKEAKFVYTIRIRLIKYGRAIVGEKITSRYGGKGVVSKIVPDEQMPMVTDPSGQQKRVEVVMNPYSTINRKIPAVIMENSLGLIAHKLYSLVEEYKKTVSGRKKIIPMLSKYYPGRYDSLTPEQFIELHNKSNIEDIYYFKVGSFSSFTPELINGWMDDLGVSTQTKVRMPEKDLTDLDELRENLDPEEYEKIVSSMEGKFIEVEKPLMAGYMCLERLFHIPSYSNKVTSSLFGTDISPKRSDPIMGHGMYRETGQVIAEQELTVLLSRNAKPYIQATRKESAVEENQRFLNNLLGLGLTISDSKGYNQGGSNIKGELEKMKNKFRLKNNR